jgi:hypothetical protein
MLAFAPVASFPVASDPMGTIYAVNLSEVGQVADQVKAGAIFLAVINETDNIVDIVNGFVIGPPTPVPTNLIARGRILVVDPRFMTVERWTSLMAAALLEFGDLPRTATEKDWAQWAQYVRGLPGLAPLGIPDPRLFHDWRSWAFAFNHAISLGLWG